MRRITILFFMMLIVSVCFSKTKTTFNASTAQSYKEIPGVTEDEIAAIEALKSNKNSFTYGHLITTEAFMMPDGTYAGFTIRFLDLLSDLFGIEFIPVPYEWSELPTELDEKKLDFTGDIIPFVQNQQKYLKTGVISRHSLSVFSLKKIQSIEKEDDLTGMNVGFLQYSTLPDLIHKAYPQLSYNSVVVESYDDAVIKLQNSEIDVFISVVVANPLFDRYNYIESQKMFSLVKPSCSMLTANTELSPIISVVDKYLAAGGIDTLYTLYEEGGREYSTYKLNQSFTDEERTYLANLKKQNKKIRIALENQNYPICFYNETEKKFQGMVPDILDEISRMTGIVFETVTDVNTTWLEMMEMLKSNQVSMVSQLMYTESRKGNFIWADEPYSTAHYALLSKVEYPFLSTHKIERVKVGTLIETAFEEQYHEWFPLNHNTTGYDSYLKAIHALDIGEIDLYMASEYTLLTQTNYLGKPDYKVNILFDERLESFFGFHKNEYILRSIISKAQSYVDTETIEYTWTSRIFDYAKQYASERAKVTLIFAIFMLGALITMAVLFYKNKRLNLNLENLVEQRTNELEQKTATLRRMSLIADNSPLYISYINKKGEYDYFNPATCDITGYSPDELRKGGIRILYDEETYKRMQEEIMPKIFQFGKYEFNLSLICKNGEQRLMTFYAFTIMSDEYGCGSIAIDVTEHKRLEQQLIEAKELAMQHSQSKSTFLSHMSHEIRTPLNAIIGMTRIAKGTDKTESKDDCLNKIDAASRQLLGVINDVLDMSKIEAGKFQLSFTEFSIEKMISKITNVFHYRFEEKKQYFHTFLDDKIPNVILSDEQHLTQVLTNLIGNAIKFTPEHGEISLYLRRLSEENGICELEFEVKDTGIGITKEFQSRIFMSYEQENWNDSQNYASTGLGLSISKHIVEMMDGEMRVESEQGQGSRFFFTIRAQIGENLPVPNEEEQLKTTGLNNEFQGKHILLVEDVEVNREIVIAMLKDTGTLIDCAEDGKTALRMFKNNLRYDLIFMDIHMPGMNGYEATREIRKLNVQQAVTVPIIAMTASVYKEDIKECLDSGMNGHIGKPLEVDAVMDTLKQYLT